MRATPLGLSAILTGLLLLTACGDQRPGSSRRSDSPACGPTLSSQATGSQSASGAASQKSDDAASRQPSGEETGGVSITDPGGGSHGCAVFRVTNREAEPFTYTITFKLRSGSGAAPELRTRNVPYVQPGRAVTGTVDLGSDLPEASAWSGIEIMKVRSVPVDEAPVEGGPCPSSGLRLYADRGDAAMGLRVVTLHLENCGTRTYRLDGYPRVSPLGEDHKVIDTVRVLRDGSSVAMSTGADGPPRPLALEPGDRAYAGLVWRNTVLSGTPVNAPYVRAWAKPGAHPVMVTPELDLGTTAKLAVGPWKKGA
ncbi:DUF4232 domain-containing protein [Streptomyces sp. NPDC005209]|uniref:DUF4232 domain-containing protein n=1 Tax=Streptomyces sp. NPDC005209 TaxID=3156715 RepID=UPI0033B9D65D